MRQNVLSSVALGVLVAAATTSIWGIMQFAKAQGQGVPDQILYCFNIVNPTKEVITFPKPCYQGEGAQQLCEQARATFQQTYPDLVTSPCHPNVLRP